MKKIKIVLKKQNVQTKEIYEDKGNLIIYNQTIELIHFVEKQDKEYFDNNFEQIKQQFINSNKTNINELII